MARVKSLLDLTGQRFGRGVVIREVERDKNNCRMLELRCDCGKLFYSNTGNLNYRHVKSCGCYLYESRLPGIKAAVEKISLPYGEAAFRELFRSYKKHAEQRNYVFEIDESTFREFTKQNCFYCGKEPSNVYYANKFTGEYIYNGIDRIDSTEGYVEGNLVPCCKRCNQGKNNMTKQEFLEWVERIYLLRVMVPCKTPPVMEVK